MMIIRRAPSCNTQNRAVRTPSVPVASAQRPCRSKFQATGPSVEPSPAQKPAAVPEKETAPPPQPTPHDKAAPGQVWHETREELLKSGAVVHEEIRPHAHPHTSEPPKITPHHEEPEHPSKHEHLSGPGGAGQWVKVDSESE